MQGQYHIHLFDKQFDNKNSIVRCRRPGPSSAPWQQATKGRDRSTKSLKTTSWCSVPSSSLPPSSRLLEGVRTMFVRILWRYVGSTVVRPKKKHFGRRKKGGWFVVCVTGSAAGSLPAQPAWLAFACVGQRALLKPRNPTWGAGFCCYALYDSLHPRLPLGAKDISLN